MRSLVVLVLVLFSGCGRFSFSESSDGTDGPGGGDGAVPPPMGPTPIHRYKLAGSLEDAAGGPSLIGMGGSLEAAGGYKFEPNQGLKLVGAMPEAVYTVDLRFTFRDIGACNPAGESYCKLLDFKNLMQDEGLYVFKDKLHFVILAAGTPVFVESKPVFSADREATVTLTRAADGTTTAYVDRKPMSVFHFTDDTAMAKFNFQGRVAHFAVDDQPTTPREVSGGSFREIAIWDVVLTPEEIAALP